MFDYKVNSSERFHAKGILLQAKRDRAEWKIQDEVSAKDAAMAKAVDDLDARRAAEKKGN